MGFAREAYEEKILISGMEIRSSRIILSGFAGDSANPLSPIAVMGLPKRNRGVQSLAPEVPFLIRSEKADRKKAVPATRMMVAPDVRSYW